MLTRKNAKGWAVLAIIFDMMTEEEQKGVWVQAYMNGREEGFAVQIAGGITNVHREFKAVFSENRNSDDIVVYAGKALHFSMQGNTPIEAGGWVRKSFSSFNYKGAAEYVLNFLRSELV